MAGVSDYWRMYRARGIRLPLNYFLECQLFDLVNSTSTHTWLPKERYKEQPENLGHGVLYMCSWTSIVNESTDKVLQDSGCDVEDFAFVDIGCGKGKVLCAWSLRYRGVNHPCLVGVEYSASLLEQCRKNLEKLGASNYRLIHQDAASASYAFGKRYNILYLYNPFDEVVLKQVLPRISGYDCYVIYNNPVHLDVFADYGFRILHHESGWHPNASYAILKPTRQAAAHGNG